MNRLQEEMRIIPRTAWIIASLVYVCMALFLTWVTRSGHHPELRNMNFLLKVLFTKALPLVPFAVVLLIGYINADAKRRGMRYVMWTFLAIFLPQAIGVILYFIFREPLPMQCRNCSRPVRWGFAFCPFCGATIGPACPQCKRAVEVQWSNCAYCGSKLSSATPAAP